MAEMRVLIWMQCLTATVLVSLSFCDMIRYHPPPVTWLFSSTVGHVLLGGTFWVGVSVPIAIAYQGIRQRLPVRKWLPLFGLSLPLMALQLMAMTQLAG
jgi:hypothetical protein